MANRYRGIYGLAKSPELEMTDEDIHALVYNITRKDSLKELNEKEITKVITRLQEMKGGSKNKRRARRRVGNSGTVCQRKKIYMLMRDLGWNEARMNGMVYRMFRVSAVEWLDYQQCSDLIEALKAMCKREGRADG